MKVIELPENYLAFVLPNASQAPPQKDLETLRLRTIDYLEQKVKAKFPSLQKLQLEFQTSEYETKKPASRFNLYIEAKASAYLDNNSNSNKGTSEKNEVFEAYVSSYTEEYLDQVIRKLGANSSLLEATEVRARRLGPGTPAGAVTAPRFYAAFVCTQEPTTNLTQSEKNAMRDKCHKEFTRLLREEFENDFDKVALKIVRTEIGAAAAKPDDKYNLYVEFEAVADFHKNVPEPMDLFRAISEPQKGFSATLKAIGGNFAHSTQMAVRCIFVETPDLPPQPEDDEDEGGAPDEGEQGEKKEKERLKVKVELGFYVALVIRVLEEMPNINQLDEFDQSMQEFFSNTLAEAFQASFVDLNLKPDPQFQAGIPLPRFNMLHEYDATIQFYHPPPDGMEVLKKILYCDLNKLYTKITGLSAPYSDMAEFTMGRALEKEVTDQAYGGKLGLEKLEAARRAAEEKKRQEAAAKAKALAEKKRKEEEAARRRAEEEARKEKERQEAEAKAKAVKDAKKREEAERKRKEEEAKRKEAEWRAKEKAKAKREPKPEPTIPVGTADVFVAFMMPECKGEPSKSEYDALAATTQEFYASHLNKKYKSFARVEVSVSNVYFRQNKPNDNYQVYIEWDIQASFAESGGVPPGRYELCTSLVKVDLKAYISKHVHSLKGTPFERATGVFTEQVNSVKYK